jgi:spore coat polysaccharide biosynthesis protein SpsF (cytidylyltransferase family)/aryl-alcohol dehydrogenase-like predicted oxidoreductase
VTSIVVIQARTSSSRLPAKVLLPLKGLPMVVLAAKRAGNTGKNLLVVTSSDASDDALCHLLSDFKIECYRGSLTNTLERFVNALAKLSDDTIVFRLTADNVFPDGCLINELEEEFVKKKLKYLACNGEQSGLPYGMSVEVMYLADLREANQNASSDFDREHVTPYIKRTRGLTFFNKYQFLKKGTYRCTVDMLEDYLAVAKVFEQIKDPVNIPALQLIDQLVNSQPQPLSDLSVNKLIIGGAQFGLNYGIANATGKPKLDVIEKIIKSAIAAGASYIDTASAYGDSETVIGQILSNGWESRIKTITKLSPLVDCASSADSSTVEAFVEASVYKSCAQLKRQSLECLMLHRASHLKDWHGNVWQTLLRLQENGVIKELGISVQDPSELDNSLDYPEINYIQMPFNIVDNRWYKQIEKIKAIKKQRNIQIHVRSAFLQGLLISEDEQVWGQVNCPNPNKIQRWLQDTAKQNRCGSVTELCLCFVRSMPWVDGIVVGMESVQQLAENVHLFCRPVFTEKQLDEILRTQFSVGENFLNPTKWNRKI